MPACMHGCSITRHDATCTFVLVLEFSHSVCITDIAEVLLLIDAMSSCPLPACMHTCSMHSMHPCAGTGVQSLCMHAEYHRGIAANRCHVFCLPAYMHDDTACIHVLVLVFSHSVRMLDIIERLVIHVFCLHAYMQHAQHASMCRCWCSVTLYP